jgi:hypothetical protein
MQKSLRPLGRSPSGEGSIGERVLLWVEAAAAVTLRFRILGVPCSSYYARAEAQEEGR